MIVELELNGRTLIKVDLWYLVLSAILRGKIKVNPGENWEQANLFLCMPTATGEHRIMVPQPPEFTGV